MLNFAVGPVLMEETILDMGAQQIPYFRTEEFSRILLENERLIKSFTDAGDDSRALFLTCSGTGAMEAAVMNTLTEADHALIINGGSFGQRFADICRIHHIPYTELKPESGHGISADMLSSYENGPYTALLVNHCETSTGVLYDLTVLGDFCKRNNIFFLVDAISSFLADPLSMQRQNIDLILTGSQKALALPPGIAITVLGPNARKRIDNTPVKSLYFNLKSYLQDGLRGQTPYTPAVGILLQLSQRLKDLEFHGVLAETDRIHAIAADFRARIKGLPLTVTTDSPAGCITPLQVREGVSAIRIFELLKEEYDIFICPNGGPLCDRQFRVGHIGALTIRDNQTLIDAFHDLNRRGYL